MKLDLPEPKKIVAVFILVGFVWIFLSSKLLFSFGDPSDYLNIDLLKGFIFVLLTGVFLFYLLLNFQKNVKDSVRSWQKSESNFRKLYENSPQPMWISCDERGVLFMNNAAIHLFGYSPEQAATLPEEVLSSERQPLYGSFVKNNQEAGENGVRQFISRSGELLFLDLNFQLIDYQNKPARLVIANDVTRLIAAEKERKRMHNELVHYKKALDRSALLSIADLNGTLLDVNDKFCEVSRYKQEELIGNTHSIVRSGYHSASFFRRMYRNLQKGKVWRGEVCNQAKDGSLFWVDLSVVPMLDEFNEVHRYMTIAYPVTDRKVAEFRSEKVQQELMTFMYKASHNLRGPVATLSGLLNVAAIEIKESFSLDYIKMLNERTRHLEFVLNELIAITKIKQEELSIGPISFPSLIKQVCSQFEEEMEKGDILLECTFQFDRNFANDEKLLRGMLFYLIDNAVKFRSNRAAKIRVEVREHPTGVALTVADNGPGISEAIRDRIYEMYFRGHEKSQGSGLGLYIVNSIVERLGGYIRLQSQEGAGSTFTIYLPDAEHIEKQRKGNSHLYLRDRKPRRTIRTGS
jgi:PAS domain S-box-containing protein